MKSFGVLLVILIYAVIIAAAIAGFVGYYINIADLIVMVGNHNSNVSLAVLRAFGVLVAPLGAILGLFV